MLEEEVVCVAGMERKFHWCIGQNKFDTNWLNTEGSLLNFFSNFWTHDVRKYKEGKALFPGVLAGPSKEQKNVVQIDALIYDVDRDQLFDDALELVRKAGVLAVLYTSHRHNLTCHSVRKKVYHEYAESKGTSWVPSENSLALYFKLDDVTHVEITENFYTARHPRLEKFRIVIPLHSPIIFSDLAGKKLKDRLQTYRDVYARVGHHFGLKFDPAVGNIQSLFYLPSTPHPELCRVELIESEKLFDVSDFLPEKIATEILPAVSDAELANGSGATSNDRTIPLKTRSWITLSDEVKAKQVLACLENISADCDYSTWKNVVCAVATILGDAGEDMVREWSASAPNRYDDDSFDSLWVWTTETFTDDDVEAERTGPSIGSLVHHARKVNPGFKLVDRSWRDEQLNNSARSSRAYREFATNLFSKVKS
jgi:hypothetical protein